MHPSTLQGLYENCDASGNVIALFTLPTHFTDLAQTVGARDPVLAMHAASVPEM
jgi:hypothetical protein